MGQVRYWGGHGGGGGGAKSDTGGGGLERVLGWGGGGLGMMVDKSLMSDSRLGRYTQSWSPPLQSGGRSQMGKVAT